MMSLGVPIAVGKVTKVTLEDYGVSLEMELVQFYRDGEPLTAVCQLLPEVHGVNPSNGTSWGRWWVPKVGTLMLCFFPSPGPEGMIGDDLLQGFALGVVSSTEEPPVGGLSASNFVYEGPASTNHSQKLHGTFTNTVDGAVTETFKGTVTRTFQNALQHVYQGDVEFVATVGQFLLEGTDVQIGVGTMLSLLNTLFSAKYYSHVHPLGQGGNNTGTPADGTPGDSSSTPQVADPSDATVNLTAS